MALTEDQRRIVEANLGLIGSVIRRTAKAHQRHCRKDMFQDGVVGLCRAVAAPTYDPRKSRLSTYGTKAIVREIYRWEMRRARVHKREIQVVDGVFFNREEAEPSDPLEAADDVAALRRALRTADLNPRQRRFITLKYRKGWSQRKIAIHFGVRPQMVAHIERRVLHKLRLAMGVTSE